MKAITEKMRELARQKEEAQLQQARDSDTLSTIVVPHVIANADQVNRSTAPTRPEIPRGDVDRATGGALRRVGTALAAGSVGERAAERPGVDRTASDGERSDTDVREAVGGRSGQLKRWPSSSGLAGAAADRQDDSDSDTSDDDQSSSNNNNSSNRRPAGNSGKHNVSAAGSESLQSTLTATTDDSRTDSSLAVQKRLQNNLLVTDENTTGQPTVSRATVI